jgi:SAM-dependent methyltransferase
MTSSPALAPGIPADYYRKIFEAEEKHWWFRGMRAVSASLLGERLERRGQRVLDAGCGTGSYLRWLLDNGSFAAAAGVDLASTAIELARARVPEADLRTAPLKSLPFPDASFDLVVSNDVLQHVHVEEVDQSLRELLRVLTAAGTLLVRTNGARRARRERDDWRVYDRRELVAGLEREGFKCEHVTYANSLLSLYGALLGRSPRAPSAQHDGIPPRQPGTITSAVGASLLAIEARWLTRPGRALPYGHTLFALATPA